MFIKLKPLAQRPNGSARQMIDRLAAPHGQVQGMHLFMQAAQDLTISARTSKAEYQYTLVDGVTGVSRGQESTGPQLIGAAVSSVLKVEKSLHLPLTVTAAFQGSANAYQTALNGAALVAIYPIPGICTRAGFIRSRSSPRCPPPGLARCSHQASLEAAEATAVSSPYQQEVVWLTTAQAVANNYFTILSLQVRFRIAANNLAALNAILMQR